MSRYGSWEEVRRRMDIAGAVSLVLFSIMVIPIVIIIVGVCCETVQDNNTTATAETVYQETTGSATSTEAITTTSTIYIYNTEGNIMKQYSRVSNVEQKDGYILFYDENGKKNSIFLPENTYANVIED